jgi:long-chain acyl-CoA synthetase
MKNMNPERPWLAHYDPGVPAEVEIPAVPVFQFLEDAAQMYPDHPCTVFQDQAVSYAEMNRLVDRLASALVGCGVNKGDRVGIFLPNLPQFVLAYYAVLKAGGVVVALNPAYKLRELEYQVKDAGVDVLIGLSSDNALYKAVREHLGLRLIILTRMADAFDLPAWSQGEFASSVDASLPPDSCWLGELISREAMGTRTLPQVSSADVAILQYSGGTTGTPKGAVGLHRNLVANSVMFRRWLVGLNAGAEVTLMAIPMYHVYGMVVGLSVSMLLGAKMVLIPDPRNLDDLLRNIETQQVSFFPGVPSMYAMINRFPDVQAGKYHLSSIRACISGSAPLLKEIKDSFEQLTGAQLMEGYGLSEAPTATHCNPMFGEKRTGSIGLPLPGVDCRIVSLMDDNVILLPGETGELSIRSPQVMREYHNRPEETRISLRDGWLFTGDIAWMDADGYFYIVDRKKELIKVSGFQVWPREIEEIIAAHPMVQEVSVAGIPDPIRGEAPKAWVVLRPGGVVSAEEIIAWCEESLVYYKLPLQVEFREGLPRTLVGKVLRRELVRQHMETKK